MMKYKLTIIRIQKYKIKGCRGKNKIKENKIRDI